MWIQITPDGKTYAYEISHDYSDLYIMEGLK